MVQLGIRLNGVARQRWWPATADYALDFLNNRCMIDGAETTPASAYGLTRSTAGAMIDGQGNWRGFAAGTLRRINGLGALLEPAASNLLRASDNVGGGGWTALPTQLTRSGDAVSGHQFAVNTAHIGLMAIEQSFGSIAAGSVVHFGFDLHQSGLGKAGLWTPLSGYAAFFDATSGIASGANTAMASMGNGWWRCHWMVNAVTALSAFRIRLGNTAVSWDYAVGQTLRIRAPQIEIARRSSYIANPSTGSAATRDGERLNLALPSGLHDVHLRFVSGAEQVLSGVSGPYGLDAGVLNADMVASLWAVRV